MLLVKNLQLPHGKIISHFEVSTNSGQILRGPNGSGKSLFLKSLSYLLACPFDEFTFEGKPVQTLKVEEFRSQVLYGTSSPIINLSERVSDFLQHPFALQVHRGKKSNFDITPYLKEWGLNDLELKHLSSGQKQMLNFLRLLTLNAKILLLDEPAAHLDTQKTLQLYDILLEWKKSTGGSYLMISHGHSENLGPVIDIEKLFS